MAFIFILWLSISFIVFLYWHFLGSLFTKWDKYSNQLHVIHGIKNVM